MKREPLLNDSFSHKACLSGKEKTQSVRRRQFLQTMGLVGASLALSPKDIFAGVPAMDGETGRWRDRVTGLVYAVFDDRRAEVISAKLSSANLYYAPDPLDFHSNFRAPYVFSVRISHEVVICSNGFEMNQFPFYDVECPCRGIADLNAFEIRRIINAKEIDEYRCVVVPVSRRIPLAYGDHADYRKTAKTYGLDPDDFKPEYKRAFHSRKKGRTYYGYEIAHKTKVGANGKPLKDVLLSSEDV